MVSILQQTCLKSSYSLRTQLLLSFGSPALISLILLTIFASTSVWSAGRAVKNSSDSLMRQQVTNNLLESTQVVAEKLTAYMNSIEGSVQLMAEGVQDRIVGYPEPGWEDDRFVPFFDMETKQNKYPLNLPPPPIDWNITLNLNLKNAFENVQEREQLIAQFSASTASGSWFMQGACNPLETVASAQTYFPNCTDQNNNFTTGGKIQPTTTNQGLHAKSGDLTIFLKPLYEVHSDALLMGVYYANSGAGAVFQYPGLIWNAQKTPYVSIGCGWMNATNPFNNKSFATPEEIAKCHPSGQIVRQREYNPLERNWFRTFAINAGKVTWYGPLRNKIHEPPYMRVGKGVFDRKTGNFIGCVIIDIALKTIFDGLASSKLTPDSNIALVRYSDGGLVSDTLGSVFISENTTNTTLNIVETGVVDNATFEELRNAVNFSSQWTFEQVNAAYQSIPWPSSNRPITAYPLPVPPQEYDSTYVPIFIALNSVSSDVFEPVSKIESQIDADVRNNALTAVFLGVLAMAILTATIWGMSRILTQPLIWIEQIASRIVNHSEDKSGDALQLLQQQKPVAMRLSLHTELNELVSAFQKMTQGFSGSGAAHVADSDLHEIRNELTWHSDFQHLHSPAVRKSFRSTPSVSDIDTESVVSLPQLLSSSQRSVVMANDTQNRTTTAAESTLPVVPPPPKRNFGMHIVCNATGPATPLSTEMQASVVWRSNLFWWIVVLIIIPLLLTSAVTCVIASTYIRDIPSWVEQAKASSTELELNAIRIISQAKAAVIANLVFGPIRDLYLLTRLAGWVYFDAVDRSESFTKVESHTEECRGYAFGECPIPPPPCPCQWQDLYSASCWNNFSSLEARYVQTNIYAVESSDSDPITGARMKSTYPATDYSPEATQWWDNVSVIPGWEKGNNASGFATTYAQLRLASAMAVAEQPIYNYATSLGRKKQLWASYIGFESDGMLTGFTGCYDGSNGYGTWQSNSSNDAFVIAPELCPRGKYGFDSRCRDWYVSGKNEFLASETAVVVTPPYQFPVAGEIATSATSALANLATGEYVGQTLLDFVPWGLNNSLADVSGRTAILITPGIDSTGGDTVVGPNKSAGWESAPIEDLLFHSGDSVNKWEFHINVLALMKNGTSGMRTFLRTTANGSIENASIAFAPVFERTLYPVSPGDFSRGATVSQQLIYSVGIIDDQKYLQAPFRQAEVGMLNELSRTRAIYISVTVCVTLVFTIFCCVITLYVTKPMITLLHIVNNVNEGRSGDNLPPLNGGSREVQRVYNTFSKLYRVVRVSNTAFFSRNLKWAFHFVSDALELFRKVNDRKAVGIACNNVGNTLFAMSQDSLAERDDDWTIAEALVHYDEAVQIAEEDFQNVLNPCEEKADYALQLSDRLFNRGLFLLKVDGADVAPEDSRAKGYKDISRAKALDYDVKDFWLKNKLVLKYSAGYFARLIRRINGLSDLYDDIGLREVWDVQELINDADQLLFAAWSMPFAPLFDEVTRVGRLQQLEGATILLFMNMGDELSAARLAMRMFVEDEYILERSFVHAAESLLRLMRSGEVSFSKKTASCVRVELRTMLKHCKNVTLNIGKCMVFTIELCERWEGDPLLEKLNSNCLKLYDRHCAPDDYMAVVASATADTLSTRLGIKDENEGRQRTLLDIATQAMQRATPAFPTAFQMVVDSQVAFDHESFLIVITDGISWDINACVTIKSQIERLNRDRNSMIHVFAIGFDVESEEVRKQCQMLCSVTKSSFYADATLETLDGTFELIASAITGMETCSLEGITMEKF